MPAEEDTNVELTCKMHSKIHKSQTSYKNNT